MFAVSRKTIISGAIGSALEMYDYIIWGLFSSYLANEFLPPYSKLPDVFFIFFITYFFRPISSLICGILADKIGRKKVLMITIFLMGTGTFIIDVLPSYKYIGIISVFFLLLVRFLQVFAFGGEYISSISLLIESCEKNKKGYYGSWVAFGVNAGFLAASLIGTLLLQLLDSHIIPSWGWRFAFVISLITTMFGFWIRYSIPESFEFIMENARAEKRSFNTIFKEMLQTLKSSFFESTLVFFLGWFGVSVTALIFIYAPIHMTQVNTIHTTQSFLINSCSLTLLIILIPFFGHLSDVFGRVKTISLGIVSFLILIVPYFICLSSGSYMQILLAHSIIGIPCACIFSVTPVLITELFPLSIRCSITSIIYSTAACLGGGITPLIALKLANHPHFEYSPGFILIIPGIISLILLTVFTKKISAKFGKLTLVKTN